jgi:beta-glucosidase
VEGVDLIIFVGGIGPSLEGEEMGKDVPGVFMFVYFLFLYLFLFIFFFYPVGFYGGDKTDLELPQVQKELLKALRVVGVPLIEVICTGVCVWKKKI